MGRLRAYFDHSLIGFFSKRAREKWFTPPPPSQLNYHGVMIQLDRLPAAMQQLVLSGRYESVEMSLLSALLLPSDDVLEIGSAMGFIGLFCLKVLKVNSLVSVEPNPTTLSYLRRNYEVNGMTPSVIEAAITPSDGPVQFFVNELFWGDSLLQRPENANAKMITVQGITFNSIMQRVGRKFNTLIIDVEGAEQYLPMNSIPDYVKKVAIEIHPDVIGGRQAYHVVETLIRSGFQINGHLMNCWSFTRN